MTKFPFKPTGNRIFVDYSPTGQFGEDIMSEGVIIPANSEAARKKPKYMKLAILAAGPECKVHAGDIAICHESTIDRIKIGDEFFSAVDERNIIGTIDACAGQSESATG